MFENTLLRLAIGIAVPLASAMVMEELPKTRMAEVPFTFQVAGQTLPAGTYSVQQGKMGNGFRIQNDKLPTAAYKGSAQSRKFGRAEGARLVFVNSEGQYRLSEVWFDSDGRGVVLSPSAKAAPGQIKCVWLR